MLLILKQETPNFEGMQNSITTIQQGFLLTSATWKEVPHLICQEIPTIGAQLNQKIHFQDFGDGVDSVLFIAVIVPPSHDDHRNLCRYNSKKKQIKIVQILDYDFAMNASLSQFRAYFIEILVNLLKKINKNKPIPDFNTLKLAQAVERNLNVRIEQ